MPTEGGRFERIKDLLEWFFSNLYGALDVHFVAQEFRTEGDRIIAISRKEPKRCCAPDDGGSSCLSCCECSASIRELNHGSWHREVQMATKQIDVQRFEAAEAEVFPPDDRTRTQL